MTSAPTRPKFLADDEAHYPAVALRNRHGMLPPELNPLNRSDPAPSLEANDIEALFQTFATVRVSNASAIGAKPVTVPTTPVCSALNPISKSTFSTRPIPEILSHTSKKIIQRTNVMRLSIPVHLVHHEASFARPEHELGVGLPSSNATEDAFSRWRSSSLEPEDQLEEDRCRDAFYAAILPTMKKDTSSQLRYPRHKPLSIPASDSIDPTWDHVPYPKRRCIALNARTAKVRPLLSRILEFPAEIRIMIFIECLIRSWNSETKYRNPPLVAGLLEAVCVHPKLYQEALEAHYKLNSVVLEMRIGASDGFLNQHKLEAKIQRLRNLVMHTECYDFFDEHLELLTSPDSKLLLATNLTNLQLVIKPLYYDTSLAGLHGEDNYDRFYPFIEHLSKHFPAISRFSIWFQGSKSFDLGGLSIQPNFSPDSEIEMMKIISFADQMMGISLSCVGDEIVRKQRMRGWHWKKDQ